MLQEKEKSHPRRHLAEPELTIINKIVFGNIECVIDQTTLSSTNIECTLTDEPVCGSWYPEVYTKLGLIPVKQGFAKKDINCVIDSITPTEDLFVLGDENLTITGTHFPRYLSHNTIDIEFSDDEKTKCIPQTSSFKELICKTEDFDKVKSIGKTVTAKIMINGLIVPNSVSLTIQSTLNKLIKMDPWYVSPVLKNQITLSIQSDFPQEMKAEDFEVYATLKKLSP